MNVSGLSGALDALQRSAEAMNRAAARIARVGLDGPTDGESAPDVVDAGDDLITGTVDSLVARSLFSAAVRLAQTTNENITAALRLGGHLPDDT